MITGRRLAATLSVMAAITLVARMVGFGRWLVFSGTVGSSCLGQGYSSANLVPNVIFEIAVGGLLSSMVVPILAPAIAAADPDRVAALASSLLTWTLTLLVPLTVAVAWWARPLAAAMLGPEHCPGQLQASAAMLRIFAPQILLYGGGVVLIGILQAHERFFALSCAPLWSSLVVIGGYLAFAASTDRAGRGPDWLPDRAGLILLAGSTTAAVAALSLPLLAPVWRAGVRLRPRWRMDLTLAALGGRLAAAALAGLLAQQLWTVTTARLANRVEVFNVLQYSQAISLLPYALLAVPLATTSFPVLTKLAASASHRDFAAYLRQSLRWCVVGSLAAMAGLIGAGPAVGAFFAEIDAGGKNLDHLGSAITAFAPGLVGFSVMAVVTRALYAVGRPVLAAAAVSSGWLVASGLAVGWLAWQPSDRADSTVLILGTATSIGMTIGGALVLVAIGTARVGPDRIGSALAGSRRVIAAAFALAVGAAIGGRMVAGAILGSGVLGPGRAIGALVAVALVCAVMFGGLLLTTRNTWKAAI